MPQGQRTTRQTARFDDIEKTCRLFETGDYADKGLDPVTEADLDRVITAFEKPVDLQVLHDGSFFKLGRIAEIWRDGKALLGRMIAPQHAWDTMKANNATKLSSGFNRDPGNERRISSLDHVAVVPVPRVASAAVMSADGLVWFEQDLPTFALTPEGFDPLKAKLQTIVSLLQDRLWTIDGPDGNIPLTDDDEKTIDAIIGLLGVKFAQVTTTEEGDMPGVDEKQFAEFQAKMAAEQKATSDQIATLTQTLKDSIEESARVKAELAETRNVTTNAEMSAILDGLKSDQYLNAAAAEMAKQYLTQIPAGTVTFSAEKDGKTEETKVSFAVGFAAIVKANGKVWMKGEVTPGAGEPGKSASTGDGTKAEFIDEDSVREDAKVRAYMTAHPGTPRVKAHEAVLAGLS
jgi:hypothetical protein